MSKQNASDRQRRANGARADRSRAPARFEPRRPSGRLGGFAALALLLASLGVYSVMAHLVAFRTSEIGLRMALGASPASVMRMVLANGRRLTLVGIAVGIAGALAVSRLMQQLLFEVDPADPLVYVAPSVTLLLVAECASWFPARRATRIDPVIALRSE